MGATRDAGDGCFNTAMFGNGSGEKKLRINEMAAYYLARAVGCLFFCLPIQLLSVPVIKNACRVHTVGILYACMIYFMHNLKNIPLFPWVTFCIITSNHLLMTTWLIESVLCFSCCQIHLRRGEA